MDDDFGGGSSKRQEPVPQPAPAPRMDAMGRPPLKAGYTAEDAVEDTDTTGASLLEAPKKKKKNGAVKTILTPGFREVVTD